MREFGVKPPPEEPGLFARLKQGLSKSTAGLTGFFTRRKLDAATLAELEELLIRADMGSEQAGSIIQALAKKNAFSNWSVS